MWTLIAGILHLCGIFMLISQWVEYTQTSCQTSSTFIINLILFWILLHESSSIRTGLSFYKKKHWYKNDFEVKRDFHYFLEEFLYSIMASFLVSSNPLTIHLRTGRWTRLFVHSKFCKIVYIDALSPPTTQITFLTALMSPTIITWRTDFANSLTINQMLINCTCLERRILSFLCMRDLEMCTSDPLSLNMEGWRELWFWYLKGYILKNSPD